jgi:hypothetical protein
MAGSVDGLSLKTPQSDKIVNELGFSGENLSKMQSFINFIITNQETPSALNENIATLIEKKNAYTYAISEIIKATKKDIARLSGAVLNSALSIPLDLLKLECIQDTLGEIQEKLKTMPVEDLYKVYTSSSPSAIAIAGVKTQIDDAINDFLNDQCKENIPKLTALIDTAYDVAKEASAAIDRIAGEKDTQKVLGPELPKVSRETAIQLAEARKKKMVGELDTQKQKIGRILKDSKSKAGQTQTKIKQHYHTGIDDYNRSTERNIANIQNVGAGGAKSYMRKPHRRRTRRHKTQRRRTRRRKTRRNSKKPRRRTIRRKKRHKRRTR